MNGDDRLELKQLLDKCDEYLLESLEILIARGVQAAIIRSGVVKSHILKQEACKRYGRQAIERWIAGGYLRQIKEGDKKCSRCRISVIELEECAARFNHPSKVVGPIRTRRSKVPFTALSNN